MSEVEPEQDELQTEAEPEEDENADELVPEGEPEPEAEPEPEQPIETHAASAEQEAIYRKLDTKADNYFKGISSLVKGQGIPLVPCELCANAYPGVRWQEPQDDPTRAMLGIIGATESGSPLQDDPDALLCDRCQGFGWTKLPSHVPGNTERLCRQCNGAGWLDRNPQSGAPQAPEPRSDNGPAEPLPGVPENDPSVTDLRSRGFTVIPPMQIGAQSEQG